MTIKAIPLTPEAFEPFGQVLMGTIEGPQRDEFAARMDNLRDDAKANMTLMRGPVDTAPLQVSALERHSCSNQTFVPLNGTHSLVAVCPSTPGGDPDISGLIVFVATGAQAVNYNADIWHAPRCALCAPGELVMLRFDNGSEVDTELRQLDEPVPVDLGSLLG